MSWKIAQWVQNFCHERVSILAVEKQQKEHTQKTPPFRVFDYRAHAAEWNVYVNKLQGIYKMELTVSWVICFCSCFVVISPEIRVSCSLALVVEITTFGTNAFSVSFLIWNQW